MTAVTSIHRFSLRGFEVTRKARVEVLVGGSVIVASDWIAVPPGTNTAVGLTLTAEPGIYVARQATNLGSNIYEDIVLIDLETFVHPSQDLVDELNWP